MGLDQYLNKADGTEVKYWRKNNQLQGWFEEHCGQENCVPTQLNEGLVKKLLEDIDKGLSETEGFFYGSCAMDNEEVQDLKDTFTDVLKDMEENNTQYEYNCWY